MESKVFEIIAAEQARQNANIELIASENFVSENVMRAVGSCLTNKYSEGYPAGHRSGNRGRYYGGCGCVDELEEYCCGMWQQVFGTDYHVNVQPHSGSSANIAAYLSVLNFVLSALAYAVFQYFVFGRLVKKHTARITGYEEERHFFLKFFDVKSFIIMAVMMSGGIWLRSSGIAPDRFIAVFYTGLGASLLTAGIRFGYQFVKAVIAAGEKKTAFQDEKGD